MEELTGEYKKKTFFVDEPSANSNQLVILSFGKDKVVVNTGIMEENRLRISRKPMPVKFDTIYSEKGENVYKSYFAFEIRPDD